MEEWLDYEKLKSELNGFMPSIGDEFIEIFMMLLEGRIDEVFATLPQIMWSYFTDTASDFGNVCFMLLLIGIIASLLGQISGIFKEKSMSDIACVFCYLCGVSVLLGVYYSMVKIAISMLQMVIGFTEVLIPMFYLAVAMTRQIQTAAGFYQLNLLLLYAVEVIVPEFIVPVISIYAYLSVLSGIGGEDLFKSFLRLIKKGFSIFQKSAFAVISGVGIMKKIVHSATDGLNLTVFQKTFGAIPALGDLSESVTGVFVGSAILIKNGLGITFLIVLLMLVCPPIIKLFLISFFLQTISSFVAMFGEQQYSKCVERISESCFMLLKTCVCVICVFMLIIALVCVAI